VRRASFDVRRGWFGVRRSVFAGVILAGWLLLAHSPAFAQGPARFSLDSAVAIDTFRGQNTVEDPNIVVDVTAVVRLGGGWLAYVRPWFREPRLPHIEDPDSWDKEIYQAAVQYERTGAIASRIDAGYIVSPIGLGMMDTRPGVNPTIAPHLSYLQSMPVFDPGSPRVGAIAASYPLGAQLTLSTARWDARIALVNSAPTRAYVINADTNPRSTPVVMTGAGVIPVAGLRFGASIATGDYVAFDEMTIRQDDGRHFRMIVVEGEYAINYTKISGEFTHDRLDTRGSPQRATAWFVQGVHTVSPRIFVAARQEGVSAPPLISGIVVGTRSTFHTAEATVGYRVTPDVTLRASFMNRKAYTRKTWDQQFGASLVWAHRWW
jgi:hypothetical protein